MVEFQDPYEEGWISDLESPCGPAFDIAMWQTLGISKNANDVDIRRAYRRLVTKEHPDKGGDATNFSAIQRAYGILSVPQRKREYDESGLLEDSIEDSFVKSFRGGHFQNNPQSKEDLQDSQNDQVVSLSKPCNTPHSDGFEAWMRNRGTQGIRVFTTDTVIEKFGVEKDSYDPVSLPLISAYSAEVCTPTASKAAVELVQRPIPRVLEWGQVLVHIRSASINPRDLDTNKADRERNDMPKPPLTRPYDSKQIVGGSDGAAVVLKAGPGCKSLVENDWVIPLKQGMGTWRSLAVWMEKDLQQLPPDLMPIEYCGMILDICVAYRLLEDYGRLKPGDAVIFNAGSSGVGQTLIQLCHILNLRAIPVITEYQARDSATAKMLKDLGAWDVYVDKGSIAQQIEGRRAMHSRPKLALDCVGGPSALRLAETLQDGAPLVIYDLGNSKLLNISVKDLFEKGLTVQGFCIRKWIRNHPEKFSKMVESIAELVKANRLKVAYAEYEISSQLNEAMEQALDTATTSKTLLKFDEIGHADHA